MNSSKPIYELHSTHREWLSKLSFYKDEVLSMQSRIEEVISKNSSREARAMIEHFQNQLVIRKEQIDMLSHDIKQQERRLEASVKGNPVAVDHRKFPDQVQLREQMESFEKVFHTLKKELSGFLVKWL